MLDILNARGLFGSKYDDAIVQSCNECPVRVDELGDRGV